MKHLNNRCAGFTLIELLVVISIISLLSSIVLSSLNSARAKARDTKRIAEIQAIVTAIALYENDHGQVPGTDLGPNQVASSPVSDSVGAQIGIGNPIDAALAPYLSAVPKDPKHDGVTYYYAYDPAHCVSTDPLKCGGTACTSTDQWEPVVSIHKLEAPSTNARKDTCAGGHQDIINADYNQVV
ncbi:MAG: General secretion pathway protein G [Parcubacteria group bacterium GW2011_GWA1_47_8]|nr:MAG: General secretion pathway protein G [Parcubacteria group bacterium GW2011_GWA1_47_8]